MFFNKQKKITKQKVDEFLHSLSLIVDFRLLCQNIISHTHTIFNIKHVYLFLIDEEGKRFTLFNKESNERFSSLFFSKNEKLAQWFDTNETFIDFLKNKEVLSYLTENERTQVNLIDSAYAYPLVAMNDLFGIVFVSRRKNNAPLNHHDLSLLTLLLNQSALALKSSLLYKDKEKRLTQLLRTDRLAVAGQLAAGAAHEIRNPLTSLRSSLQYILKKDILPDFEKKLLGASIEEVDRIDDIVSGFLAFSKPDDREFERFNFKEVCEKSFELIKAETKSKDISFLLQWNSEYSDLYGDKNQIKQVILNLSLNAVEAMHGSGTIILECTFEKNEHIVGNVSGKYVIRFKNTGDKIPLEFRERIFDPFFTTKSEGTGLGLFIIYGIIKRHQGEVELERSDDKETCFKIILPRKDSYV